MRKITERCVKSSRKRHKNNSKKWKKQLLEVGDANERFKINTREMNSNRKGYVEQQRDVKRR
jgi:hypothetical protein